jgi:Domain of unknown function (DUF4123)
MVGELVEQWNSVWALATIGQPALRLFALVDPAQNRRVVPMIASESVPNECLFGYEIDSPIAVTTPRLVSLDDPIASRLLGWLLQNMPTQPVATLLASTARLPAIAAHLRRCLDVELEGLDSMTLALWDPAILGTLVGQPDDDTLHVSGPALQHDQIDDLLAPLSHWWYCDRLGRLHDAVPSAMRAERHDGVIRNKVLVAAQVDDLVEASVPDHLLQHIRQNQPELLERLPGSQHYQFVQQQLCRARQHGLKGTGDLVNYTCLALAFGSRFDELPSATALWGQVKDGSMTFNAALDNAPESEWEANMNKPVLL